MPEITIDQRTYDKLGFSAALMNRPIGDVVRVLVERLEPPPDTTPTASPNRDPDDEGHGSMQPEASHRGPDWLPVYRVYKRQRFEGEFNPSTMELRVLSAPWSGQTFSSPTAAAQEVVAHVPGERKTNNTNGRKFWRLQSNRKDLRSVIGERF